MDQPLVPKPRGFLFAELDAEDRWQRDVRRVVAGSRPGDPGIQVRLLEEAGTQGLRGSGRPSDPIGQLPLPILVDVDGHRLRHYVAIQTHLEIEQAWIRIPGGGIFRIGIHASVIDHLSAVQPPLKEAAFVCREADLKSEIGPLAAQA